MLIPSCLDVILKVVLVKAALRMSRKVAWWSTIGTGTTGIEGNNDVMMMMTTTTMMMMMNNIYSIYLHNEDGHITKKKSMKARMQSFASFADDTSSLQSHHSYFFDPKSLFQSP